MFNSTIHSSRGVTKILKALQGGVKKDLNAGERGCST